MALAPLTFEDHLERVGAETCKAAAYLAASRSWRFAPSLGERSSESAVLLGVDYMRQGIHLGGLVSLCAVLEQARKSNLVNLPALLRQLEDVAIRRQLADRRGVAPSVVFRQFERIRIRYRRRVEPFIEAAKAVRDNIAAHHGRSTTWPEATYGRVFRLAARTVVLVDQIHLLANDERSNIQDVVRDVRWQSAAAWSKGIEGGWEDSGIGFFDPDSEF
jgi:hypothetical protein